MVLFWVVAPVHAALLVRPLRSTFVIPARCQLADAALLHRKNIIYGCSSSLETPSQFMSRDGTIANYASCVCFSSIDHSCVGIRMLDSSSGAFIASYLWAVRRLINCNSQSAALLRIVGRYVCCAPISILLCIMFLGQYGATASCCFVAWIGCGSWRKNHLFLLGAEVGPALSAGASPCSCTPLCGISLGGVSRVLRHFKSLMPLPCNRMSLCVTLGLAETLVSRHFCVLFAC